MMSIYAAHTDRLNLSPPQETLETLLHNYAVTAGLLQTLRLGLTRPSPAWGLLDTAERRLSSLHGSLTMLANFYDLPM